jgi:hypothetical protein
MKQTYKALEKTHSVCYRSGMPKKDFSQIAFSVVQRATGEMPNPKAVPKKKAAPPVKKVAAKKNQIASAKRDLYRVNRADF